MLKSSRRNFLRFLAASPLLPAGLSPTDVSLELGDRLDRLDTLLQDPPLITAADQALNVFDFEPAARSKIPPAHWAYLATGVDDDGTIAANRTGYSKFALRPRRLRDVAVTDTSVRLLGARWNTPIALCPVSSLKAFHPDGEIAAAKAAKKLGHLQMLSTVSTTSIEDVIAARGAPVWYQLYPTDDWNVGKALVQRAERAGAAALVVTVDLHEGSNRETLARGSRLDQRQCSSCHESGLAGGLRRKPMFDGLDLSRATTLEPRDLTWASIGRIRTWTKMPIILKGIGTREDAALAVRYGADGIIVSNHGGRAENSLRSTIESLPEITAAVRGRLPILLDGGIRRGTDIFKAMALGATTVGIGRPYAWGLGAFGQEGVEAVLAILTREVQTIMRQCGVRSMAEINRGYLVAR